MRAPAAVLPPCWKTNTVDDGSMVYMGGRRTPEQLEGSLLLWQGGYGACLRCRLLCMLGRTARVNRVCRCQAALLHSRILSGTRQPLRRCLYRQFHVGTSQVPPLRRHADLSHACHRSHSPGGCSLSRPNPLPGDFLALATALPRRARPPLPKSATKPACRFSRSLRPSLPLPARPEKPPPSTLPLALCRQPVHATHALRTSATDACCHRNGPMHHE